MQMQMAVDMVERQAGGVEFFKLGMDFGAQLRAQIALEKITEPGCDRFVAELPRRSARPGIFSGGSAACPISKVRCKPTPSCGFCFASFTAPSNPRSFTIKLAVVRMPSQ